MRIVTGYVKVQQKNKQVHLSKIPIFIQVLKVKNIQLAQTLQFTEIITKIKVKSLAHLAGSY